MSDMDDWIKDLDGAPIYARREVRPVVARGALNIKKDWQDRWTGLSNAPALARAVTYDIRVIPQGALAEIGPDKAKRQGDLGNVIEYGTVNNPPHPGGAPALEAEEPRFMKALEDLGVNAIER